MILKLYNYAFPSLCQHHFRRFRSLLPQIILLCSIVWENLNRRERKTSLDNFYFQSSKELQWVISGKKPFENEFDFENFTWKSIVIGSEKRGCISLRGLHGRNARARERTRLHKNCTANAIALKCGTTSRTQVRKIATFWQRFTQLVSEFSNLRHY